MTVGKVFVALLIAFFWMCFAWFIADSLTNPLVFQTDLKSWILVSLTSIIFLMILAGTIMIVRLVKNEPGFWSK